MLRKYNGVLGNFEYNDSEFRLKNCTIRYVGRKRDGSKIKIPKGIVDCSFMFEGTKITIPPIIPEGVECCNRMFKNCACLNTAPIIPDSVTECFAMFENCVFLQKAPEIPKKMVNCSTMFAGCVNLKNAPAIPIGVVHCNFMFQNCVRLETAPTEIPETVKSCMNMFDNCRNLKTYSEPPEKANNFNMYRGCETLFWTFLE